MAAFGGTDGGMLS